MKERMKELIGKNVFIILKTGRVYNGIIRNTELNKVTLTDKFGEFVLIDIDDISSLEVKK